VLNLETGSLAVEAALKMVLARFYRIQQDADEPIYAGRVPVILVMGSDDGGLHANYHGTTLLTQTMRGMWGDLFAKLQSAGVLRVHAIRPNRFEDVEEAFARFEGGATKIAGFFHEIVMMNYGAVLLTRDFLQKVYEICRAHDVPTVADEIQSCMWTPGFFLFREYGLKPTFAAVGKGFPGGEYPASRILFNSRMDGGLPQFGALVTNGQEELASLAYLITMRWAGANADVVREIGDYYEARLREFAAAHADRVIDVRGLRHMCGLVFDSLKSASGFASRMVEMGFDVSAQTYKADCPPVALTKLPLIVTREVVDFLIARMEAAIAPPPSEIPATGAV
jgi:4-aminobutyrate aminotransferase-like enzyme